MRTVIRNCRPRVFYKSQGVWTWSPGEARRFGSTEEAARFALRNGLSNVELILGFEDELGEFSLQKVARLLASRA